MQQSGLRYYATRLGRWTTRDPIGEAGSANAYSLADNGPIYKADANGMFIIIIVPQIPPVAPICPPGPYEDPFNMFLDYWLGLAPDVAGLGPGMSHDVYSSTTVTAFVQNAFADAKRGALAAGCGSSGKFALSPYSTSDFTAGNGFWNSLKWLLSGNWQLSLRASAAWDCGACRLVEGCDRPRCDCNLGVRLVGYVEKHYTFMFTLHGNKANICTGWLAQIAALLHKGCVDYDIYQPLKRTYKTQWQRNCP